MSYYIGLDLGGTTLSSAVVDQQGAIVYKQSNTLKSLDVDYVVNLLVNDSKEVAKKSKIPLKSIIGIGVGCPGVIDAEQGKVVKAANFPTWNNVMLSSLMSKQLPCPVFIENDANCAAAAEAWVGAGKSVKSFVMLTLGTGIGGGMFLNHSIHYGIYEPGHMIVELDGRPCGCGQNGCLERYCSAKAVERQTKKILKTGEKSILQELVDGNDDSKVDCRAIWEAAKKGDALAQKVTNEAARYLALACINTCRDIDPQRIVMSGGMSLVGTYLFNLINKYYDELTWNIDAPRPEIIPAVVGNTSGIIGAAYIPKILLSKKRSAL